MPVVASGAQTLNAALCAQTVRAHAQTMRANSARASLLYLADKAVMLDCMRIVWADGVEVCEVHVLQQSPDGAGFIVLVEAPAGYLWLTPAAPIFTSLLGKRWRVTPRDACISGADTPQLGSHAGPTQMTLALVEAGPSG